MALCLLMLLIGVSATMIAWGLSRPDRLYQYPTLAGVAWLGYIVPQAIGVYNHPRCVPAQVLADGGLELSLGMSLLCAVGGFVGYIHGAREQAERLARRGTDTRVTLSPDRLLAFGIALYIVAFTAFYKLDELCGGGFRYFSTGGAYALQWRGEPVVYAFFVKLVYPGLLLCLVSALRSRTVLPWLAVAIGLWLPLANTILLGRRQNTVILLLIFAIAIYFARRWSPPRFIALCTMVLGAVMIAVAPAYRTNSQLGSDHERLTEIDLGERITDKFHGRRTWVFENAVVQMAAVHRAGSFGHGWGVYNRTVQLLVPRAVVGDQGKESLLFPTTDHRNLTWRFYRWVTKFGTYSTGPCDAFREFWFCGAVVFVMIAKSFRWLWLQATVRDDLGAQLCYTAIAVVAMNSVVNNVGGIPAQLACSAAVLGPVMLFSRVAAVCPEPSPPSLAVT